MPKATSGPAKAPKNPSKAKKTSLVAQKGKATLNNIRDLQDQEKTTHGKAANTSKKYAAYVKSGRQWLAGHFDGLPTISPEELEPGLDTHSSTGQLPPNGANLADGAIYDHPEFKNSFLSVPNQFSDKALALFISYKCFHENLSQSTAEGAHAAFKLLWKNADGDTYRGKWTFHEGRRRWEGNPAESAEVRDVMEAVKHKCGAEGGDRKHSLAMSKQHMEKIYEWSEKICPKEVFEEEVKDREDQALQIKHLLFRAFASTSWTVWTRNFEGIKIKRKDITFGLEDPRAYNLPYFLLELVNRKGWQHKLDKTHKENDLRSNKYKIFAQPNLPACDAFEWLPMWVKYLEEKVYQRPMEPDDYIFPAMGANGVVHPREHVSHDTIQKWINEFVVGAQVPQSASGSFSTHCFRRGGAQYRFMFAPVGMRWTLRMVRWWGGWAEGENRDTLLRYLLDELQVYEDDYSGALCPVRSETDVSLLGEHRLIAPVSTEEVRLMHGAFSAELRNVKSDVGMMREHMASGFSEMKSIIISAARPSYHEQTNRVEVASYSTRPLFPINVQPTCRTSGSGTAMPNVVTVPESPHAPLSPAIPRRQSQQLPLHSLVIPDVPLRHLDGTRSPMSASWREIVQQWEHGDKPRGLHTPLKDWPREWTRKENKIFAQKRNNRGLISVEFLVRYNGDEAAFLDAYPEANHGHSKLLTAINVARARRGERIARKK